MITKPPRGHEWLSDELERLCSPKYSSCVVIVDATQSNYPIVFATAKFMTITGYERDFIIGKNARFLHGPETCTKAIAEVKDALKNAKPVDVEMVNYTKGGRKLINSMSVTPFFDTAGQIKSFGAYVTFTPVEPVINVQPTCTKSPKLIRF